MATSASLLENPFPVEIISSILSHLPNEELFITARQVSRVFLHEAERLLRQRILHVGAEWMTRPYQNPASRAPPVRFFCRHMYCHCERSWPNCQWLLLGVPSNRVDEDGIRYTSYTYVPKNSLSVSGTRTGSQSGECGDSWKPSFSLDDFLVFEAAYYQDKQIIGARRSSGPPDLVNEMTIESGLLYTFGLGMMLMSDFARSFHFEFGRLREELNINQHMAKVLQEATKTETKCERKTFVGVEWKGLCTILMGHDQNDTDWYNWYFGKTFAILRSEEFLKKDGKLEMGKAWVAEHDLMSKYNLDSACRMFVEFVIQPSIQCSDSGSDNVSSTGYILTIAMRKNPRPQVED